MYRFYCPSQNISSEKIIISNKEQTHHLRDVLRLKINNRVIVFDNKGNEYICLIKEMLNNQVVLKIKDKRFSKTPKIKITVACAIPKKSKMDDIIDKLTQLGVDRIIPLKTSRAVIKWDKHKETSRLGRWRRIALSASQQSQRNILPVVDAIKDTQEVLSESQGFDLKLIPTLIGKRKSLREVFINPSTSLRVNGEQSRTINPEPKNVLVLIGPEGDFSDEEVGLAIKAGCIPLTLGDLVLRVETAAIAVVSILNYALHTDKHG